MKKIEYLMIFNAIISQIGVSIIFTFIEGLFLEISENFFIKLFSSNIFNKDEVYENKSLVKRIRDITIFDPSQTNITIWTSILGAYFINKFGDLKILFISYLISIISLILIIFLPYKETQDINYREFSDSPFDFKFLIPSILILITLSISIGNYNLHSLQYIVYYYNKYKGFLIPFYVGIGCLIKYGFIMGICLFFGDSDEYQNLKNYKLFLIFCTIFISICFLISFLLTYGIENLINKFKSDKKEELKDLIIKTNKKENFKNSLKLLFFGEKSSELYFILILNLFSKIEKIEWKYYNEKNLSEKDSNGIETQEFINSLFIILSFFVGYIHDKYDFNGFKIFLLLGNFIDIILSIFFSIYALIKGKNDVNTLNVYINYISLIFIGNYYAIMLPELMRKYGPKFILELSGFIGLSNILSRLIEVIFTVYPYDEKNNFLFFGIMFLQILCSIAGIVLLYKKKITNQQHQEFILNEIIKKDNDDRCISLSILGIKNNKIDEL